MLDLCHGSVMGRPWPPINYMGPDKPRIYLGSIGAFWLCIQASSAFVSFGGGCISACPLAVP